METREIHWKRIALAITAGSLVSAIVLGVLHSWSGYPVGRFFTSFEDFPALALIYLLFVLLTAVLAGVPAIIILDRLRILKGSVIVVTGTILGAGWSIPLFGQQPPPYIEVLFFAFGGFFVSSIFWLVYAGVEKTAPADARIASDG